METVAPAAPSGNVPPSLLARMVAALDALERGGQLRAHLALYRALGWALSYETNDLDERVNTHAALGLAGTLAFLLEGGVGDDDEFFEACAIYSRTVELSPMVGQLARVHRRWKTAAELCRAALNEQAFGELVEELEATVAGGAL